MRKILVLLITVVFIGCSKEDTPSGEKVDENGFSNPLYLDSNGVTIKSYEWGEVGDTGEVNGINYTIVSEEQLRDMISNNEDLSKVCTSKIYDFERLFVDYEDYDWVIYEVNGDISNWDVSNVTSMNLMFYHSNFNGDISNWDVSNVTDMSGMFQGSLFNGDISNWDVSKVYLINCMFCLSQFNGDASNWDVSSVTYMDNMFNSSQFTGDISNWDVSSVTNMTQMFWNSVFNQDLFNWNVINVTECTSFSRYNTKWTLPKPNFTNCDTN